jgi:hypothetical protein
MTSWHGAGVLKKVETYGTRYRNSLHRVFSFNPISLFHRILPAAGLAFAVIVNAAWIVFLGFGLFKLIF